jgi:tRNA uridine 5-carboxymethylaminomethyl modification enzyme
LRADNADARLTPLGIDIGAVGSVRGDKYAGKAAALSAARVLLESLSLSPSEAARAGIEINKDGKRRSAFELLSYQTLDVARLSAIWPQLGEISPPIAEQISVDAKYASYVERQDGDVATLKRDEGIEIPHDFDFDAVIGLSNEARAKLKRVKPTTLAQAGQIDGMTPSALMLVLVQLKKGGRAVDVA